MTVRKNRISAIVTALVFGLVILFTSLSFAKHASHSCTGEKCAVCAEISQLHRDMKAMGTAYAANAYIILAVILLIAVFSAVCREISFSDPVTLKVKLLD
ncbi:hypothetical protein [Ruminococcus flavefaciens]|uniref:hypothetical protein n=1 Tax=Ruminococcus flavefaciens TaxID=1265 RepID=UPI0026F14022|nr:hypothetical protein [Ruminococcus flavefaciens]MDD7518205.1 hypothetical protein [Ruminococcus flavefaciens]MDY5690614.1 hypothetical protein [Ruminococcus flavefaciens]